MTTPQEDILVPPSLKPGSVVAIVSPSGWVKPEFVTKAARVLRDRGYEVRIMPHTTGRSGSFAGTDEERLADLKAALLEPTVDAVLCSRGGYGAVHLLEEIDKWPLRENPKWLIGFSDISALHSLLSAHGIMSLHAPMAKHLAGSGGRDDDSEALFDILAGNPPEISFPSSPLNRPGEVTARIYGGNLAVIMGLFGTPYDIIRPGTILFIEDIAEPVYKVERQLYQLRLAGVLDKLAGLVVGQFTDYSPDINHQSMEEMISGVVGDCRYPVAFNAPIGHVDHNIPVVEGSTATLTVTPERVTLSYDLC
ncbi:MAG: LD-carboxypeptidase [Clostridium sp.]|nr:LD-carboxypeptidase [Clostridium sp.]